MKQHFILLFSIILFSIACKPQKSVVEYKYTTKTDTLVRTQINTIYQQVNDTLIVENPCDSTGILNQFYAKISIPFGSVKIRSKNNKIEAIVDTKQIKSVSNLEKSKSTSDSIREISKEIIKYRTPNWVIYLLIAESLLIISYIVIKIYAKRIF